MALLSPAMWKTIVQETGWQFDMISPKLGPQQIFTELMGDDDAVYQGWEIHRLNALASWNREGGEEISLLKNKFLNDQQWRITVQPLWYQGILLDTDMKAYFKGLDDHYFDGGYLGVVYTHRE